MNRWRLAACCCALLLLLGNAAVVQVVAWSVMIAQRAASEGVAGAVASTLSGERPCALCRTAAAVERADPGLPAGVAKLLLKKTEVPVLPPLTAGPLHGGVSVALPGWADIAPPGGLAQLPELPPPRC